MKKRKITYSLTAQQKKQLKRQQEGTGLNPEEENKNTEADTEAKAKNKKLATTIAICSIAGVLAVVMIVFAILIPIWVNSETVTNNTFLNWKNFNSKDPEKPYDSNNPNPNPPSNPIITFTLTSDNVNEFKDVFGAAEVNLEYEVFISDAPAASCNLLYLAESGFYNGTIINDIYNGHAMINGFTDTKDTSNRSLDVSFVSNLKGFIEHTATTSNQNNTKFKLGYRLNSETSRRVDRSFGYMVMVAGTSLNYCSSTAFLLITRDDPQYNVNTSNLSWVGKINNDEQYEILTKLNGLAATKMGDFYCPDLNIRIKSVKTNLSAAKKKYLLNNFESIIKDSGKLTSNWRDSAYYKSDYNFS